jgi:hypothetical protein
MRLRNTVQQLKVENFYKLCNFGMKAFQNKMSGFPPKSEKWTFISRLSRFWLPCSSCWDADILLIGPVGQMKLSQRYVVVYRDWLRLPSVGQKLKLLYWSVICRQNLKCKMIHRRLSRLAWTAICRTEVEVIKILRSHHLDSHLPPELEV